jgi:hypothetical protein
MCSFVYNFVLFMKMSFLLEHKRELKQTKYMSYTGIFFVKSHLSFIIKDVYNRKNIFLTLR